MKTPEQKTFVVNAIAKHPSKRTAEEKAAILQSMTEWENEATMKTTQHTPKEWEIIGRIQGSKSVEIRVVPLSDWSHEVRPSIIVKGDDAAERAQFIVTACNAHYELLEACEAALDYMVDPAQFSATDVATFIEAARAAIAKRKGIAHSVLVTPVPEQSAGVFINVMKHFSRKRLTAFLK